MSEQREDRRISRRTIAKGTAWSVPVAAVLASAPAQAEAVSGCTPSFTPQGGSFKCCDGAVKNMKLVLLVEDTTGCIGATAEICITDILPTNGGTVGQLVFDGPSCVNEDGEITVYLLDVSNCTVNLTVYFTVDGGDEQSTPLKSGNIANGNTDGDCVPA